MLNAGGGVLVYGIASDGTVEDLKRGGGLLSDEPSELDAYRKLIHDFIKPPANIELEEIYLSGGELVFLFHVDQDYERLFQRSDNEAVYLRVRNRVSDHKETILAEVLERTEKLWPTLTSSQKSMISLLFNRQEATIARMVEQVGLSDQAIRYNLKKFEEMNIVERLNEKIRDPKALYRFKSA